MNRYTQLTVLSLGLLLSCASMKAMDFSPITHEQEFICQLIEAHNLSILQEHIETLKESRANIRTILNVPGMPLIMRAIEAGDIAILQYLIVELGMSATDMYRGKNALHWAIQMGQVQIAHYLVEDLDMDTDTVTQDGLSLLALARIKSKPEVLEFMADLENRAAQQAIYNSLRQQAPVSPARPTVNPATPKPVAKPAAIALPKVAADDACPVCQEKPAEVTADKILRTTCHNGFMCADCAGELNRRAAKDYEDFHDMAKRNARPETADGTWSKNLACAPYTRKAECPICRKALVTQKAQI